MINIATFVTCVTLFALSQITTRICISNIKVSKLVPTVLHAVICSVLSFYCIYTDDYSIIPILRHWSIAYFSYDFYNHIKKYSPLFLGHHIASILVFYYLLPENGSHADENLILFAIWAGEMGNFTVYRVNYKMYNKKVVTHFDLALETFAFLVWRNFIGILTMVLLHSHWIRFTVFCFWSLSV